MRTVLCLLCLALASEAQACHRNANGLTAECVAVAQPQVSDSSPVQPVYAPVAYHSPQPAFSPQPVTYYYQQAPAYSTSPVRLFRGFRGTIRSSGNCANGSCQ